jgi:hypothetical protein
MRTLVTTTGLVECFYAASSIIQSLGYPDIPSDPTACNALYGLSYPTEERCCIMAHGTARLA